MRIAMLQQNFIVGDFRENAAKILAGYREACSRGAELVVSSELAVFGYPPKDMLERDGYIQAQLRELEHLKKAVGSVGLIVGYAAHIPAALKAPDDSWHGARLFNAAALLQNGAESEVVYKSLLPTYDVFDEARYFIPNIMESDERGGVRFWNYRSRRIGVLICEDIWHGTPDARQSIRSPVCPDNPLEILFWNGDNGDVASLLAGSKLAKKRSPADIVITINASPYYWGKGAVRNDLARNIALTYGWYVIYVNQVGGNDDLGFDGRSFAMNPGGECIAAAKPFAEDLVIVDTDTDIGTQQLSDRKTSDVNSDSNAAGQLYAALVQGLRDYFQKTGFTTGVIGLSGGIDSALTACIAADAIGADHVIGLAIPSRFSSAESVEDARVLAQNLGLREFHVVPIDNAYENIARILAPVIGWNEPGAIAGDVTEENVQPRIRMICLMAVANRRGALLISTGNKSELSVGYCTLYGDMTGGFSVIGDVYKTDVYALALFRNTKDSAIPERTMTKPPSAELRPGQLDTGSLPPYEILDGILKQYIEEQKEKTEIIASGHDPETVAWVIRAVWNAEHKRRQAPMGEKVSSKAFGSGRRYPIAARFLE